MCRWDITGKLSMKKALIALLLAFTGTAFAQYHGDYVDMGLPSGTQWKIINENGLMTFDDAVRTYGNQMPTQQQFEELIGYCQWEWTGRGIKFTGPNGKFIVLQDYGKYDCSGNYENRHDVKYWSRTELSDKAAYGIFYKYLDESAATIGLRGDAERCNRFAIRLVR